MNGGDGRLCAFQSTDCPSGTSFVSPRMLEQGGGGLAHGGACATKDGTENIAKIGSCVTEGFCASEQSLCADPQDFVPIDDRCTVRVDGLKQNNGPDTLFGKCTTDNTCYWSSEDCADQEAWKKPSAGGSECTCEEVRVGACVDANGFYYCGVSAQACSSAGMWIDAPTLMRTNEAPECFLCRQLEVEGLGVIPDGTITSTPNDTSNPEAPTFFTSDDGNNTAIIASVTVGGVILFCVLLFGIVYIKCLRRPSEKTASDIPLETITDTSANHDIEDLSTDGI